MMEKEARTIAVEFASKIGLPTRSGSVLVHVADSGGYELLISADPGWLATHHLPSEFKGLAVLHTDRIVGQAHRKAKAFA
jgi:hypothetical protein